MNFIEALEFLVENTTDKNIRIHGTKLLEVIKANHKQAESRIDPDLSFMGASDKVIVKVQRGENKNGELN